MFKTWGQCEPLTQRLHNILRDYPNGTQIFRELIQNADDAEASKVVIMLDMRDFSKNTTKLLNPEMSMLQVPSIVCYNNATFQEKDFESLKNLGASRKENEPTKTGRFGIGFNSVYVSDVRSINKA
jgi:sacsin